jgi:hypothetical protein
MAAVSSSDPVSAAANIFAATVQIASSAHGAKFVNKGIVTLQNQSAGQSVIIIA